MVYVDTKCSILPDPQAQKLVCAVLLICLSTESTSEWKWYLFIRHLHKVTTFTYAFFLIIILPPEISTSIFYCKLRLNDL